MSNARNSAALATTLKEVPRRQTVLTGAKDANGLPIFMAAGTGLRLSLAAAASALVLAFASGATADKVAVISSNAADMIGADVPASVRSYVHADFVSPTSVTWGSQRKAPQKGHKLDRATLGSILHFGGADASTSIIDDYGNTWTASGNAQIDTAQSSVGGSSLLLDGTGDYVTTTDITCIGDPNTGAFTVRGKARFNALPANGAYACMFQAWLAGAPAASLALFVYNNAGTYRTAFFASSTGGGFDIASDLQDNLAAPTTGVWYDWAVAYDDISGHYRVYWNGVQTRSVASTAKVARVDGFRYGANSLASNALNGWLDECVYEPYCLYPAGTTFTPPTTAFSVNGHWYDNDAGIMYEVTAASVAAGTNPAVTARDRLFVGEALAGASSITSVRNYMYAGRHQDKAAFRAHKGSVDQGGVTTGSTVKITCPVEVFDIGGHYDHTLSRWTPPPGPVVFGAIGQFLGAWTAGMADYISIGKNGLFHSLGAPVFTTNGGQTNGVVIGADYANGTDYYEIFFTAQTSSGNVNISGNPIATAFWGYSI